jgi:hypothetical protein
MIKRQIVMIALALFAGSVGPAAAQLATPSARSYGLADSYMARARGYEAPFWNPANLGLSDRPAWSIGLAGATAYLDNNSLSYGQIEDLYGEYLDNATKSELLAEIREGDPDRMFEMDVDLGANVLAVSIWRFGIGVGTMGAARAEVSPDALELLLFGNIGEDGSGRDFSLEGSQADGWAFSGAYLSYAQPFTIPALDYLGMRFSIGATVKYGVAHGLVHMVDSGSTLTYEPLAVDAAAEVLVSTEWDAGRMWAADVGAAMEWGSLVAGISLINAYSSIEWNEEMFELTQYAVHADYDSSTTTDTTVAFEDLSPADQEQVTAFLEDAQVPSRLRLGVAWEMGSTLTLSADYMEMIGGTLRSRWQRHLSAGAELRALSFLPLRAGLATDFEQFAIAGGLGIYAGPVHLDLSAGRWGLGVGDGASLAVSLSIWPGRQ